MVGEVWGVQEVGRAERNESFLALKEVIWPRGRMLGQKCVRDIRF